MDVDLLRRIDRWVGVPLCRLLSLLPGGAGAGRAEPPRRILFIMLSEMGSLVLADPMFRELGRRYPQASLYALLPEKSRELVELLGVMPPENIVTIDDTTPARFLRGSLAAVRALRRIGVDAVIDGELFTRASSILARLSGASVRVGFHRHTQEGLYRGGHINRPVLYNPYQHVAHQFLTLVEAVGSATWPAGKRVVPAEPPTVPRVVFAPAEIEAMRRRLAGDFPGLAPDRLVLLQPGGGTLPIRAWPQSHYERLAAALAQRGYRVAIIGPAGDRPLAGALVSALGEGRCLDLTGYTRSIRELLLLFSLAPLLIANDGGPAQFSALTPIAAIVLFGPETPQLYGRLNPGAVFLHNPVSCSPCATAYNHRKTPCDGDAQCLKGISPELVLSRALAILEARGGAGGRDR